ncbi:MatP_C domain-containing protein [Pseudomonas phage PMBT54]|nr:MatP_C domain-containing protein [Pseudomonas phage PMBT54]
MATDRLKNISVSKEVWTQLKLLEAEKDCTHTQVLEYLLQRSKQLDEILDGDAAGTNDLERTERD